MLFPSFSASSTSFWRNFKNCTAKFHSLFLCCTLYWVKIKNEQARKTSTAVDDDDKRLELAKKKKLFRALKLEKPTGRMKEKKRAFLILNVERKTSQKFMSFIMPNIYWARLESVYFIELIFQFIPSSSEKDFKRYELILRPFDVEKKAWKSLIFCTRT